MKQNVEIPQVGESITSGILAAWLKQDGEMVQEGEDLFELETDKATMPVPAPVSGVLSIRTQADEEVEIGTVVAVIDTEGQVSTSDGGSDGGGSGDGAADAQAADAQAVDTQAVDTQAADTGGSDAISPAVRRVLDELGLDAAEVTKAVNPSGKGGRLTKADVEAYHKRGTSGTGGSGTRFGSSPTPGSSPATAGPSAGAPAQSQPKERKKMSPLRRTIAANLVRSKQESAHLTTFNEVDMSAVMAIRADYKESFEKRHGVRLGFMSFFIKAAQRALVEFPAVNAFIDGEEIVYNHFYNIGVAISTDKGLIVPVIRNVEALSFAQVESTIIDFAGRAKEKRIMPDEFTGGTFTITNGGVFGSMLSTPIPSPPQTAVLGMHSIQKRAVVVDDEIVIRPMMYLAITYDHRVIDGREAISFLNGIKNRVEDPTRLLLDV